MKYSNFLPGFRQPWLIGTIWSQSESSNGFVNLKMPLPGYKNNNDDQTAFSLLFKLYGFRAFSVEERDAVVYTGRNLAKFIKEQLAVVVRCRHDFE